MIGPMATSEYDLENGGKTKTFMADKECDQKCSCDCVLGGEFVLTSGSSLRAVRKNRKRQKHPMRIAIARVSRAKAHFETQYQFKYGDGILERDVDV